MASFLTVFCGNEVIETLAMKSAKTAKKAAPRIGSAKQESSRSGSAKIDVNFQLKIALKNMLDLDNSFQRAN